MTVLRLATRRSPLALRQAGIVQAVRGARGGYSLARHPSEITVLAILEALEGPMVMAECPGGAACCSHPEACALEDLWAEGTRALTQVYEGISLAALLERQRAKEAGAVLTYSI